jgi:hypothetical protein
MQLVPAAQSRVARHRSTQWPSAHVPLRQSAVAAHAEPAGAPAGWWVHRRSIRVGDSTWIRQDSPGAQSTSLVHASPDWPRAITQKPRSSQP